MPRFTANQLFQIQNNINNMKRTMNKPSNMSLNQYFQENSAASLNINPDVLKLRPSQFHNKNEWDGDIMKLEYTINKENVLREHFSEPEQELQNYNIPLEVDKQNKLMKSINNIIREVQKSITEDNLGTTYLNIVKLFNDFSLSYNASVSQIRDDKNFQLIFNERLITLEDLIRTCLQTATIGRYNEISKTKNYRYSTTEFLNAFQDMITIIGEMLITKNISLYVGDARPSQISVQPSLEVEGKEGIDDMRDDAEEIEMMRRRRDDVDHFRGDREEGFDRGVEESKGLDEGMVSTVVQNEMFQQRNKEIRREEEGVDDGEEPLTTREIEDLVRELSPEELKRQYLIVVNNFIDISNEIKRGIVDEDEEVEINSRIFLEQVFNPTFRMNVATIDEALEHLERIKTDLTGTEAPPPPRDTDAPPPRDTESPLRDRRPVRRNFKSIKAYFQNEVKTSLLPLLKDIVIKNISKSAKELVDISYSNIERFETEYRKLFTRIVNIFYDNKILYDDGTASELEKVSNVFETNGYDQMHLYIIRIMNAFLHFTKLDEVLSGSRTQNMVKIINSKIQNKLRTDSITEFELFLRTKNADKISLFDYENFDETKLDTRQARKLKSVLSTMKTKGF
jgi:hypothetical protein